MLAIVIVGQMRSYRNTDIINSYKKYLDYNEIIDLYIFTWTNLGYSNRHGNPNINSKCNDIVKEDDILDYYNDSEFINVKHIIIDNFDNFIDGMTNDLLKIYNTPFRNHSKVSTCIPIQYKYQQAARHLSNLDDIDKYSNIIITRPDICFVDYLPTIETKLDNVYYNCICVKCMDHCWYGKPKTIIKPLYNIYDEFLKNHNEISSTNQNNRDNNALLRYQCIKNNIKFNIEKKHMVKIIYQ